MLHVPVHPILEKLLLLPQCGIVEPTRALKIHPPESRVAGKGQHEIAAEELDRLLRMRHAGFMPGECISTCRGDVGGGVILQQIQLAGPRDALRRRHDGAAAAILPVAAGERRTDDVDIRSVQQPFQLVVPRLPRSGKN